MKKLFVSCPVKGREWNDIVRSIHKMHEIAKIIFDQDLELIDTLGIGNLEEDNIDSLVRSLNKLSEADYFIGIDGLPDELWRQSNLECMIAREYGIPCTWIDARDLTPDVFNIMKEYWDIERTRTVDL